MKIVSDEHEGSHRCWNIDNPGNVSVSASDTPALALINENKRRLIFQNTPDFSLPSLSFPRTLYFFYNSPTDRRFEEKFGKREGEKEGGEGEMYKSGRCRARFANRY